ncbi:CD209 antigen-like protein C [Cyanocitta cristata]
MGILGFNSTLEWEFWVQIPQEWEFWDEIHPGMGILGLIPPRNGNFGFKSPRNGNFDLKSPQSGNFGIESCHSRQFRAFPTLFLAEKELLAELELLKANFSGIWDSVQQEQTRMHFGIRQHQLELQEVTELLCRTLGSSRTCQAGWKSHGSSCYSFSMDSLGWASARNACADLGAHLVVVNSELEQMFLLDNSDRSASYWLGASDGVKEGDWEWVTGEEPDFRFWDVWVTDPDKEHKDCGAIGPRGFWIYERCSHPHRWICEKSGNC